jgi:carboxypeptidase Taq
MENRQGGVIVSGEAYSKLLKRLGEISDLASANTLLEWDQETKMPAAGADARASVIGTVSQVRHELLTSPQTAALLDAAAAEVKGLGPDTDEVAMVREARFDYDLATKLPTDFVAEFAKLKSTAQGIWAKARAQDNFALFEPSLTQIFAMVKRKAEYLGYTDHPYDALLKEFEPGMTTAELRRVFADLKARLVPLLKSVLESPATVDDACLHQDYPVDKQREVCETIIQAMGLDFEHARLDTSAHPFMVPVASPHDARLTTRFLPNFLNAALFGSIHESGHALFELGINPAYARTPLAAILSMSLHESQSRLWENLVGRSRSFWSHWYPRLQEAYPQQLAAVPLDVFYRAINKAMPSFIRVEADELTYNLHIILRFELELDVLEGKVSVAGLPAAWKDRFEQMFGICPATDREGVLQDIHWSIGAIGYFPTYALGNLVSAQLWEKALADVSDLQEQIAAGKYGALRDWLRTNIHCHGRKYPASELVTRVTGKAISPEPFMRYLNRKYSEIYSLKVPV